FIRAASWSVILNPLNIASGARRAAPPDAMLMEFNVAGVFGTTESRALSLWTRFMNNPGYERRIT
ncbi:MAG: hypothetical protein ACRD2G_16100, partial [Terriglobia bacterium]